MSIFTFTTLIFTTRQAVLDRVERAAVTARQDASNRGDMAAWRSAAAVERSVRCAGYAGTLRMPWMAALC